MSKHKTARVRKPRPTIDQRRVSLEETLCLITIQVSYDKDAYDKIYEVAAQGQMGLIETLRGWAHEFEKLHAGREWDGEWFDEIDAFVNLKLSDIISPKKH